MYGFKLPDDFLIGTANSAFQSEGAWDKDGKSQSWIEHYAKVKAGTTTRNGIAYTMEPPDRGCFFYDNYEAYIEDMQKTGQNTYRMSLAWPRIIPDGYGKVNQKAIDHYNKVIDKLLSCGITPFVDLYHWDLPQCLDDQGGFLNPNFPEWFEYFAKVCFEAFGDRVKLWSTFNEPQVALHNGYCSGTFPPYHTDMAEYLQAAQNCLIAHFRAIRQMRQIVPDGKIGIVNAILSVSPIDFTEQDVYACELHMNHYVGWWTEPLVEGTYPRVILRENADLAAKMPAGFQEELDRWFTPMDFLGLNYYMTKRTRYEPESNFHFKRVESFYAAPGQAFAPYPPGLFDAVQFASKRYHGIDIYITENGCALPNIYDEEKECDDEERVTYIREHLRMCARLISSGYTNLKGYYYWNDADSYEQSRGYDLRFGLTWVDHKTGKRRWKKSRYFFSQVCKTKMVN